ncbi:hypothetical protein [Brevibacillus sp. SYSU BS000544]|uniref:hypothetical protein n=1 Tax=Brevibacillus sp. SYSU BS000544 TaxID=3416443 RepID=UPI003CE4ACC4
MLQIDLSVFDATVIPAMLFLLWIAIQLGVSKKFIPLLAVVLCVPVGLYFIGMNGVGLIAGILLASSIVGFHSGTKNTMQFFKTSK